LQYLNDQGLVRSDQEGERRTYQLTQSGQAELEAQAEQVAAFWSRVAGPGTAPAAQHEVRFLQEELDHLNHLVWRELRPAMAAGQVETVRRVRSAVEECRNKVREIVAAAG
jgi:DNA-binding PadR family transcriptional regulator